MGFLHVLDDSVDLFNHRFRRLLVFGLLLLGVCRSQHAFFDQEGGRYVYFEGTYTNMFSGNPCQTPRYEYNQIMYRLDLADERLKM